MREKLLSGLIALQGVSRAAADVQFIDFWKTADAFSASVFEDIDDVGGKKYAQSFSNRYERVKRAMSLYQDSGPCDSAFTNPTYELVEMKEYNRRNAVATNIENLADMLDDWMNSYACVAAHDRVSGKRIRVPRRSVVDMRSLGLRPEFQPREYAYVISSNTMDYDEALASCYLQGMYLANPDGDKNRLGSLREALDVNQRYWFEGDNSCSSITGEGVVRTENCQDKFHAVCQSGHFTDKCYVGSYKTCTSLGDPHYITFDGEFHHFQGSCEYTMVEVDAVQYPNFPWFRVRADLAAFSVGSPFTWNRGFVFEFMGEDQEEGDEPRYTINADGWKWQMRGMVLEDKELGVFHTEDHFGNPDFQLSTSNNYVSITTWFGVTVSYKAGSELKVKIPDCYIDNVDGLCGNWDGVQYDEYAQIESSFFANWQAYQSGLTEWAEQFEVPDERCRQIHDFECNIDLVTATDHCLALDPNNLDGAFSTCNIDRTPYHTACMIDVCERESTRCASLRQYAEACINDLAPEERGDVCSWENELGCEGSCPWWLDTVWNTCADTCAARKTCQNRHLTDFERCGVDFLTPEIEGMCVCEPGFIKEGSRCIPEAECGCTITSGIYSGYYLRLGASRSSYDDRYECTPTGLIVTPIPCEKKRKGYCNVHSDPWIETFDGFDYGFHGNCRYNLVTVEDTPELPGFSIDIKNRRREDWGPDWDRSGSRHGSVVDEVWISFHSSSYIFGDERRYSIYMNNMDNSNNYRLFDPVVLVQDHETGLEYTTSQIIPDPSVRDIAMEVEDTEISIYFWNSITVRFRYYYWTLEVFVPPCYKDVTTGLCGNWNDDSSDEEQIELDLQADAHALGERFVTEKDDVCNHGGWLEPCANLTATEFEEARERCAVLKDGTAVSSIFNHCSGIDKQPFFDACLFNTCIQDDFACGHINEFAQTCLATKHPSLWYYDEICSWPEVSNCAEDCPGGQIYKGCSTTCIEARTCDDVVDGITDRERCGEELVREPMCGCPLGQVWHGNECIDEDFCPTDCDSTGTATCSASGDPHYRTFDGEMHHFQGTCKYTFAESEGNNEFRNMPAFKVVVDQQRCGPNSYAVSCIHGFTFEFYGKNQHHSEVPRYFVTIDGTNMNLEDRQGDSFNSFFQNDDLLFDRDGVSLTINTWFGVSISYSYNTASAFWGYHGRLDVTIPNCYVDQMTGLCGNYNEDQYDEFDQMHSLSGWRDHQLELSAWANDFSEDDPVCREVHDLECDDVEEIEDLCIALDETIPGGPFNACPVDKRGYYLACLIDTCEDREQLCPSLSSYARQCINALPASDRGDVCNWAAELDCEEDCGANMDYNACANVCTATRTCQNRHISDADRCAAGVDALDSMCVCKPGFILDNGECISEVNCGCVWGIHNQYYRQGARWQTSEERCECTAGGAVCTPIPCEEKPKGICLVDSDPFIFTFDDYALTSNNGDSFDFHGSCKYNLVSAEDAAELPGFKIDFANRRAFKNAGEGSIIDEVWAEFHGVDYTFGDEKRYELYINNLDNSDEYERTDLEYILTDRRTGQVFYNQVDFENDDVKIYFEPEPQSQVTVTLKGYDNLKLDYFYDYWTFEVIVPQCYKNKVSGLCGDWNGNNFLERQMSADYRDDPEAFGELYVTEKTAECNHGRHFEPCADLNWLERNRAEDQCHQLKDGISHGVFRTCPIDKQPFFDTCLFNACIQDGLGCGAVRNYARQCLQTKDPASWDFINICNWPRISGCEQTCPAGQIYKGCTSACIEQRTCDDVADGISNSARCGDEAAMTPMCGCPDRHVWHNEECIHESECPRDCPITGFGRCRAWGDPHYTTFDGGQHHFQGRCKYTFVESAGNDEFRNMPAFKVEVDQEQCGAASSAVSCIDGWTFEFPGRDQGPDETPRYMITLAGRDMVLEDRVAGRNYRNWWNGNDDVLAFRFHCGYHHMVRTWFGASIDYYYKRDDLQVTLPDCYRNSVTGLCGNWNGVAYDEFSSLQGLHNWRNHQTELVAWANDFAEPDPRCREVHDLECDDIDAVTDLCVELDKNIPGGVFHECTVDKDDFYLACLIDTCQDRSTLCSTYKAYASECLNSIAAHLRPQICTWANELGCEDECGENMVFEGCANVCSATKTCADRHLTDAERCGARINEIDSVCVCEAGYIFDGDDCILEADCGCVWDYNNVYYSQGSSFNNDDERCECTSSGVVCTPIPCHEKSWRDCRAHNDPYIATFDGPWLGFHGDCRYNLARAEDTTEMPGFNFDSKNRRPWLPFGGAVTDEIWFDFHSRDYTFGDAYRYTLHVRNLDDSSSYSNANFEYSVTDNSSGEQIDVGLFYYTHRDFTLRLSQNWDLQTSTVFIETATASVEFKSSSWTAKISVSDCYKNTLDGLCGNFNDNNSEELMNIRDYRADSDAFGDRFVTEDDGTCSHGDRLAPCEDLNATDYSGAAFRCDALRQRPLNSASRSVFAGCEFLGDRSPTYEACLFNSCVQDDLHCGIMEQYASDCLARKDPLSADYARICNWASATGCEEECPVGQIYKGCTSLCIEQRTCDDVVDGISNADRCGVEPATAPACGCPDGQVWHNEECIDESECPRDCDISQTTQCRAWGDPHYTTFDGGHHHFQGACKYTFVESAGNEDFRNSPAFKIDVDQRICGNAVSCIRGWTFEFPGQDQGPNETPRYIITLEGTSMVLEDRFEGNSYNRWWNGNADVLEFKFHCGVHHIVRTWFGLRIDYWYERADLRVSVPNCFMNHVTGLCGNWNGVSYDEFSRLQGIPGWRDHQTELVAWANDFAEPDPRCREVHDLECDDIDAVTDMCVPLDKNIPGGAFNECTVDKDDFYLACLVDTCQDRSALCSTFKAYATECLNNIAAHLRPQICTWATELGCEETCGANMNYEGCANVCSATKTCMDRHLTDAERCGATINDIDSLCVCQPGFIFDGEDCILEADCGCVWDFNNVYYSQGESFNNADERCECTAAGIVCTPIPCDEKRWGYCVAHNDPYIRSFDGPQLGFHGNCRYNLARAEDTLEMPGFNVDAKNRRPWLPFAGAVTDEIFFDFHGEDYTFGDTYKYSFHVRNLDTSSNYWNSRFEITLTNNHNGNKIYDAVELINREFLSDDGFTLFGSSYRYGGSRPWISFRTEFVSVYFNYRSWKATVSVSDCYRNELSGLCGNFNGNNAEELDNIRQYALDSDAFGDEFETENDGTCSHGDRLTPCEDLSAAEYNEAANRCDALRQSPMIFANRNIFAGCEFLGDRTPTHEACLFNSCVQDDLHCGIMSDYASQCLERKDPLSADYARICNWAAATGCEEECQADQVFKGCGNVCHEQQTCEDHVRGISREDRCAGSTFNSIEAMCGCPEGHVLEEGTCVAETSCGCLTDTDEYVEQGSDISTETEICTCGSNGELTCEPLNCPCDDQLFCVDLVCDAPRDFVGGPEGIVGTFQVTRNYELGYEFTCDYPISDGGFSAGEHIGPHIFDGDMSRMQESFRGVSTDNEERMSRKMARSWGNAGNMWFFHSRRTLNLAHIGHEKEHGSYTVDNLYNACVPGFNSIRITQEHDAETDAITKRFFFNGVLKSTKFYASSTNMYLGELTASLAFVGEEFGVPPGQIRNFYFRDTERTTFVGATPQVATGGNVLMDIDLNKSFVVHFELDCAAPFTDGHVLDIREQNIARISMQQPDEDPRITLSDKPFMSFSRSSAHSFEQITMAYGDGETITNPENFPFLAGPNTQTGFQGDFNYKVLMSWMSGCPVSDNWTTFLFEHIFDENTGLWTNRWSANGIPVVAVSYSIQNFPGNYQLGFTNNPAGGFISSTALRNFWYKEV